MATTGRIPEVWQSKTKTQRRSQPAQGTGNKKVQDVKNISWRNIDTMATTGRIPEARHSKSKTQRRSQLAKRTRKSKLKKKIFLGEIKAQRLQQGGSQRQGKVRPRPSGDSRNEDKDVQNNTSQRTSVKKETEMAEGTRSRTNLVQASKGGRGPPENELECLKAQTQRMTLRKRCHEIKLHKGKKKWRNRRYRTQLGTRSMYASPSPDQGSKGRKEMMYSCTCTCT